MQGKLNKVINRKHLVATLATSEDSHAWVRLLAVNLLLSFIMSTVPAVSIN